MNQQELTDRLGKKERIKKINKLFSKLDAGASVDDYEILRAALIKIHDNPHDRDMIVSVSFEALQKTK